MSKKNDSLYFDNFISCAECSTEAALILKSLVDDFNQDSLLTKMKEVHEAENKADQFKHVMMKNLVAAFITPIERDDILKLSQIIDDVTDDIDDIVIRLYTNNVKEMRPDAIKFCDLIIKCCDSMKNLLVEFKNFKKSKTLAEHIIAINDLEETGDDLYINAMKDLHTNETDPIKIIAWREIYNYFEKCCDACEHVADIIESITLKNT